MEATVAPEAAGEPEALAASAPPRARRLLPLAVYVTVALGSLLVWTAIASVASPWFFPSPLETAAAAVALTRSGDLPRAVGISYIRILSGWALGCLIAVPVALIAGRIRLVRLLVEPYLNFFRFVPPIAFLGIAILWFGIGENSKIAIIVYTSTFTVFMNTMAGAMTLDETPSRAALSLGASRRQVLLHVVLPATVPAILVGMRVGMGFSFMTVIAAELVAAEEGVGFLIYNARLFLRTANAFAGIITLGVMGFAADLAFRWTAQRIFRQHALPF
jgi:NitT/TauT family transport system permease protein